MNFFYFLIIIIIIILLCSYSKVFGGNGNAKFIFVTPEFLGLDFSAKQFPVPEEGDLRNKMNAYRKDLGCFSTNMDIKTFPLKNDQKLPKGFCIIRPKFDEQYFTDLYNELIEYSKIHKDEFSSNKDHSFGKRYYMFDNLNVGEIIDKLKFCPKLKFLIEKYINLIMSLYEIKDRKKTNMPIIQYESGTGMHCHYDMFCRGGGTTVACNLGSDIYYDIIPIKNTETSFRVKIPINSSVIIEDVVKYEYYHCIPDGIKYDKEVRFGIIVRLPPGVKQTKFSEFWNAEYTMNKDLCDVTNVADVADVTNVTNESENTNCCIF